MFKKNIKSKRFWVLFLLFYTLPTVGHSKQCLDVSLEKAGWVVGNTHYQRLLRDASLPLNKEVSTKEKQMRIKGHIDFIYQSHRVRRPDLSSFKLSKLLTQASDCTGNDFSMLAAVVAKESLYCYARHNRKGGDSGCGQFTSAAIIELKNQLRLPGRKSNGSDQGKEALERLLFTCFDGDKKRIDEFADLFSLSSSQIRQFLRTGQDIELDIIATAMYLKLMYGLSGFYYNPHVKQPGALSRYNGGGTRGYAGMVQEKAQNVDFCALDTQSLLEVEEHACAVSADPDACHMVDPSFEI